MITLKLTLLVVLCIPLIAKLDKVSNDTITKEETNKLLYNIIFFGNILMYINNDKIRRNIK